MAVLFLMIISENNMQALDDILKQAQTAIAAAADLTALEHQRVHLLGKKGALTNLMKNLGDLPPAERPAYGQKINAAKDKVQLWLDERLTLLKAQAIEKKLSSEAIDVTLPGRKQVLGSIHPIQQTFAALKTIFGSMGFSFEEGPEVETDYYNFTALNIPPLHPARGMQDTFYFGSEKLLRSQMSPVQIHSMKKGKPPLRMVALGKVYRRDFDLTHTPMFHQMECLMIDEHISIANLKGLLKSFLEAFFATKTVMRFRPSYFPFTEPSAEVDIKCIKCEGKGCRICKNTGWLEVLGCGMVHPNVLQEVNIDPKKYRGFAFGLGIDRLTMLKYNISDLRSLFENDIRFLKQF